MISKPFLKSRNNPIYLFFIIQESYDFVDQKNQWHVYWMVMAKPKQIFIQKFMFHKEN